MGMGIPMDSCRGKFCGTMEDLHLRRVIRHDQEHLGDRVISCENGILQDGWSISTFSREGGKIRGGRTRLPERLEE